nr:CLIP domain-containing serine protease B8-like [Drosophila takahashii]
MTLGLKVCTFLVIQTLILTQSTAYVFKSCPLNEKCVRLSLCPHMKPFVETLDTEMSSSQCGLDPEVDSLDERLLVCCPDPGNVLPNEKICGQRPGVMRIYGGTEAKPNEFPWMAMLLDHRHKTRCSGSLINNRYVLTAAHCVNRWTVTSVRLGEHDTSTDPDYFMLNNRQWNTAAPYLQIGVENITIHRNFDVIKNDDYDSMKNDIALLRLKRPVTYTKEIRPICLLGSHIPSKPWHTSPKFEVAGWGYTENNTPSDVLLKATIKETKYWTMCPTSIKHKPFWETRICAGGKKGRDTCYGDSGGPLMATKTDNYTEFVYLAGITSYGPRNKCGKPAFKDDCSLYEKCVRLSLCPHMKPFAERLPHIRCGLVNEAGSLDRRLFVCCPDPGNVLPNEEICGRSPGSLRIYGGTEAKSNEFPWVAMLLDIYGKTKCSGSLINNRYVLTAAHCAVQGNIRSVRLGEHYRSSNPDKRKHLQIDVENITVHRDFDVIKNDYPNDSMENDIALLRLERPVSYTKEIRPICLLGSHISSKHWHTNPKFEVAGWGYTENNTLSDVLLKATIKETKYWTMCPTHPKHNPFLETRICAGGKKGRDTCYGDSGGPLMATKTDNYTEFVYLAGITSYGPRYECGKPGVYTRTEAYIYWILNNIMP